MHWITPGLGLLLFVTLSLRAVEPIPESQQAAMALKILRAYSGTQSNAAPRKLHVAYFTPADRDPEPTVVR